MNEAERYRSRLDRMVGALGGVDCGVRNGHDYGGWGEEQIVKASIRYLDLIDDAVAGRFQEPTT